LKKFILFIISFICLFIKVNALTEAPIDITSMSVVEIETALEKGYITSEQLVNLYLERIEAYDDKFNSINTINEHVIEQAQELDKLRSEGTIKGELHGIPIVVKCNIDVYGMPTTAGSKSLKDNYPTKNAYAVQKLIDEGAIILASTNMSEFAFSAVKSTSSYGTVKNVFEPEYTTYGSSGGSAVAVKAAFAPVALGTDTNSSVRLPASGAGLVGIRPTLGLVSRNGVIPYDIERDTIGVISSNVEDSSLILNIISGEDSNDSETEGFVKTDINLDSTSLEGVNIGVATQYIYGTGSGITGTTDSEIKELIESSIKELQDAGANIIYLDNFVKSSNLTIASTTQAGITMCDSFNEYIKNTTGTIRNFRSLATASGHIYSLKGYLKGCGLSQSGKTNRDKQKAIYRNYISNIFDENNLDVVLYPTLKNKIYLLSSTTKNISPGSSLGSVIGYPSISIPMGTISDGFSYNIEFISKANNEEKLYNVAYEYEKINGNKITTSSLTPSLYEIPESVTELVNLYNDTYENSNDEEWLNKVKDYFKDYNNITNKEEKANELLTLYRDTINDKENDKKEINITSIKNKTNYILKIFILIIIIIFLIFIIEFIKFKIKTSKKRKVKITKITKQPKTIIINDKIDTTPVTEPVTKKKSTTKKNQTKKKTTKKTNYSNKSKNNSNTKKKTTNKNNTNKNKKTNQKNYNKKKTNVNNKSKQNNKKQNNKKKSSNTKKTKK